MLYITYPSCTGFAVAVVVDGHAIDISPDYRERAVAAHHTERLALAADPAALLGTWPWAEQQDASHIAGDLCIETDQLPRSAWILHAAPDAALAQRLADHVAFHERDAALWKD